MTAMATKLGWTIGNDKHKCESCPISNAKQKNSNKNADLKSTKPCQVFVSDISSIKSELSGGCKYWLLVVDQYTEMKWSFFLQTKDKHPDVLVNFVREGNKKRQVEC
jgi:hypothetical protein